MRLYKSWLTPCAVAAAVLAGCGGSKKDADPAPEATATAAVKVIQPGAPGEPSKEVELTPTPEGGVYNAADVEFMQGMIHHHRQALEMTSMVDDRTQSPSIKVMAKRMHVSQEDEIVWMQKWLRDRKIDPSGEHAAHEFASMPGMLTEAQLKELQAADGKPFDRLFIKFMTQHHQGAIQMVQQLLGEDDGGHDSDTNAFILGIDSDQGIEIERMAQINEKL